MYRLPCGCEYDDNGDPLVACDAHEVYHQFYGLEPIRRTYDADELGIDQEDD